MATGLFIADLVSVIWLGAAGFFPLTMLGVTWTSSSILPIILFDAAIIVLLVHFGWNTSLPVRSPSERNLLRIAGVIFFIVAVVHLLRVAFDWKFLLGDAVVPMWFSWCGIIVAGYLSYSSFHFARRVHG